MTITFRGDFDTGNLSQWDYPDPCDGYANIKLLKGGTELPVRRNNGYSARFIRPKPVNGDSDCWSVQRDFQQYPYDYKPVGRINARRTEVVKPMTYNNGTAMYYGWSTFFPDIHDNYGVIWTNPYTWQNILQFCSEESCTDINSCGRFPPDPLYLSHDNPVLALGLNKYGRFYIEMDNWQYQKIYLDLWIDEFAPPGTLPENIVYKGLWNDFVLYVVWTYSTNGAIELYHKRETQPEFDFSKPKLTYSGNTFPICCSPQNDWNIKYITMGIHHENEVITGVTDQVIYHDEFVQATTLQEILCNFTCRFDIFQTTTL